MSQIKYRPGDRVVIKSLSHGCPTFTLKEHAIGTFWHVVENASSWNEAFFVHEHIYNSPLYQALL